MCLSIQRLWKLRIPGLGFNFLFCLQMICSLWRIFRHDEDDDDDDNDEEENGEVFAMHLCPYVSV